VVSKNQYVSSYDGHVVYDIADSGVFANTNMYLYYDSKQMSSRFSIETDIKIKHV
jgi:hypothetical protein